MRWRIGKDVQSTPTQAIHKPPPPPPTPIPSPSRPSPYPHRYPPPNPILHQQPPPPPKSPKPSTPTPKGAEIGAGICDGGRFGGRRGDGRGGLGGSGWVRGLWSGEEGRGRRRKILWGTCLLGARIGSVRCFLSQNVGLACRRKDVVLILVIRNPPIELRPWAMTM